MAGAKHPGTRYKGRKVFPMSGKSFLPFMQGKTEHHRSQDEWVGYELMGNSAFFQGDYKAVRLGAWLRTVGVSDARSWKLYNIKQDPSELHDLSRQQPKLLATLIGRYDAYSKRVGVIDVPADFDPAKIITQGKPKKKSKK